MSVSASTQVIVVTTWEEVNQVVKYLGLARKAIRAYLSRTQDFICENDIYEGSGGYILDLIEDVEWEVRKFRAELKQRG
jgi:hypothetical protein